MVGYREELGRIKNQLKAHPRGLTITGIARLIGINRNSTAKYLGNLQDAGAVDALIKQLEDEDQDVRFAVAEDPGRTGDAKAFEALASHSTCDNGYVCIAIDEALHRLNKKD